MSNRIPPPKIDPRKASDLLARLREIAPHYTKEWPAKDDDDPGVALLKIFSFIAEGVINRLNRAPERNFLSFLDMLGIRLLPATPARAPVRFIIAQGTENEILVARGTQVSAPPTEVHPEELPFETKDNLLVIPSALTGLIAVDPEKDQVYKPPPGFLELALAASELPRMTIIAFSAAGSKSLQIDLAGQLQEGDFLRIELQSGQAAQGAECVSMSAQGQSSPRDYVVVSEIKGQIVTLTEPLTRDYSEATVVRKLTQFELFEGKNFQAHMLFLAHSEYFDIKSDARFTLSMEHAPGAASNLDSLNIVWEFFGVLKATKEEGWHAFAVELDGTSGMSEDGRLILIKPPGEIKEAEINGNKSRWIRARLVDPIPATIASALPKLESILLTVSSQQEGIPADQAFHNDTPLTVNFPFNPFGPEPRTFDRFYIASAEAFSKPGAEVKMELDVDFSDLLAAPAAIFQNSEIRAFAHAATGRLVEFPINPNTLGSISKSYGTPAPNTRITARSIPAVVSSRKNTAKEVVAVFVKADDDTIYLLNPDTNPDPVTNKLDWYPLPALPGKPKFDPAAVSLLNGDWQVNVVANNQVLSKVLNALSPKDSVPWTPHPGDFLPASTPFPVLVSKSEPSVVWVVVNDDSGNTFVLQQNSWKDKTPKDENGNVLKDFLARRPKRGEKPFNPRPFALAYTDSKNNPQADIFLINENGQLVVFATESPDNPDPNFEEFDRKVFDSPPGVKFDSNPYLYPSSLTPPMASQPSVPFKVFVRGSDNRLWELELTRIANNHPIAPGEPTDRWQVGPWVPHSSPLGIHPASDPFVISYLIAPHQTESISVLSTSDKNVLLEVRLRTEDVNFEEGRLQAGPHQLLILQDRPNPLDLDNGEFFLQITDGPGTGTGDTVRRIIDNLTEPFIDEGIAKQRQVVILEDPLDDIPTSDTAYMLFSRKEEGFILGATRDTVWFSITDPNTIPVANDFVFINNQIREIKTVELKPDVNPTIVLAILKSRWENPKPNANDHYDTLVRISTSEENAQEGSSLRLVLKRNPDDPNLTFEGKLIEITQDGSSDTRGIAEHFKAKNHVIVERDFDDTPRHDSSYKITLPERKEVGIVYRVTDEVDLRPQLSWEYWNGSGWLALIITDDTTENFLVPGFVKFTLPDDIAKTEVAGQESYWIRARIVGGDYGRELFEVDPKTQTLKVRKDPIRPPLINSLSISYEVTEEKAPQFCLTFNNLAYLDQTAANVTPDKHFHPFVPLPDESRTLYMGFNQEFEGGPVNLFFAAKEMSVDESTKPKLAWTFASDNKWIPIVVSDGTDAFTKPEIVSLNLPGDFQKRQLFGNALYWVRAALVEGKWDTSPLLSGLFINTVEAIQARTVLNEILGSSTGTKNQRFTFRQLPVLEGQQVRVREVLTQQERDQLVSAEGEDVVLEVKDQEGRVLETWVKWTEVLEFFDSRPGSRNYRLDRASGKILFGDDVHGKIPPAGGDNIRAISYQAGGGAQGNVAAGEINAPVTAVAGIESVINPVPAGGGSDKATAEEMLEIGPAQVSHRNRAVTPEDFERLAKEASREVRKALCLPNRNQTGRSEVGWTSIYIVPNSEDAQPMPSLELRRTVRRYLAPRADATLVDQDHIFVGPPLYVPVNVTATVFARSLDVVSVAELKVNKKLSEFLHPLTGGPEGEGWDFGRDLAASDLYLLLEDIEEVDHVGSLSLHFGDSESDEFVEVGSDALLAGGTHDIRMLVVNGE